MLAYPRQEFVSITSERYTSQRGWGLGFSIMSPMPIPTQRYDYVWHTPDLKPLTAAVGAYGGSDHLPVFVTFQSP